MEKLENFLEGKKTLIGAAIVAIAGLLRVFKYIDQSQEDAIRNIGIGIATFGMYAMVKKNLSK